MSQCFLIAVIKEPGLQSAQPRGEDQEPGDVSSQDDPQTAADLLLQRQDECLERGQQSDSQRVVLHSQTQRIGRGRMVDCGKNGGKKILLVFS